MFFQPQKRGPHTLTEGLLESETEPHELSAEFVLLSQFPARWASCHFLCTGFFLAFSFHHRSFHPVGLLLCLASTSQRPNQIVSAMLNMRNGTIYVKGVCSFLGSVSLQQKFEVTDGSVLLPCVIAQFYLESKGNISSRHEGRSTQKTQKKRSPQLSFGFSFYMFFSSS